MCFVLCSKLEVVSFFPSFFFPSSYILCLCFSFSTQGKEVTRVKLGMIILARDNICVEKYSCCCIVSFFAVPQVSCCFLFLSLSCHDSVCLLNSLPLVVFFCCFQSRFCERGSWCAWCFLHKKPFPLFLCLVSYFSLFCLLRWMFCFWKVIKQWQGMNKCRNITL